MPTDNGNTETPSDSNQPKGPGQHRMQPRWIVLVALYLVIASVAVLYGLIKLWPYPTPGGTEGEQPTTQNTNVTSNQQGATASQPAGNTSQNTNQTNSTSGSGAPQNQPGTAKPTNSQATGGTQSQAPGGTQQGSQAPGGTQQGSQAPGGTQQGSQATGGTQQGSGTSQTPPGSSQAGTAAGGASQSNQPQTTASQPQSGGSQTTAARGPCAAPTPTPKPGATPTLPDPECISFLGTQPLPIYLETRLLLLVMLAGALGSLMHALRSLYWYTGNRMMVWSWVAFYLLLPITGAILAVIFYFVVRGGFFSPQSSFANTSPYGFAALAALVGLFSPQATLKLKEIAETIFSKPGAGTDNKPQESASQAPSPKPPPTIAPSSGAPNDSVVISGSGFSAGAVVKFGGVPAQVSSVTGTSITVVVPENAAATGPVDVEVINADGQSVTATPKFTYVAGGTTDAATTDERDGHDEIKSNTTDEELPITEGGVE